MKRLPFLLPAAARLSVVRLVTLPLPVMPLYPPGKEYLALKQHPTSPRKGKR